MTRDKSKKWGGGKEYRHPNVTKAIEIELERGFRRLIEDPRA